MSLPDPRDELPRTWAALSSGIDEGSHIGAQCYVSRDGTVIADFAMGDARPSVSMRTETLMPWLSSGKPVTAIAVGQLQERGLLDWNDPVCRFVPEFAFGGKEDVTILHLLTHTAGFRSADKIPEDLDWTGTIQRICETPLEVDWPVGERAGYHISSSWMILGEIVQRMSRRALWQYVREEIFLPIGMADSWVGMPVSQTQSYGNRNGLMHHTDSATPIPRRPARAEPGMTPARPGSDAQGPIRELGRFYEWLIGAKSAEGSSVSNRVLRPETIERMTQRHRVGLFDQTFRHTMDWGLGFMLNSSRYGSETVPYGFGPFASEESFGHSGAQSSAGFADPKHRLVVAWVCNGMPGERRHQQRAREVNSAIYTDLQLDRAY